MPTEAELRDAFRRSGIWRLGWDFNKAIGDPAVLICLSRIARNANRPHPRKPRQRGLFGD